jgi:Rieske Fe-S protein
MMAQLGFTMARDTNPDKGLTRLENESQAIYPEHDLSEQNRRSFLSTGATVIMAGGLVGGYGMFFAMAGRYFYPTGTNRAWIFVSNAASIKPGDSIPFQSPVGVSVMITRLAEDSTPSTEPTAKSFLALSSICPHLGCRVHWESNNNRFFCPCHNGVFDPNGKATGGPPAADGQDLPHYALQVVDGALYIEMPITTIGKKA